MDDTSDQIGAKNYFQRAKFELENARVQKSMVMESTAVFFHQFIKNTYL
jgi:hypothetical protein